jgi:hypothetical protein
MGAVACASHSPVVEPDDDQDQDQGDDNDGDDEMKRGEVKWAEKDEC